MIYEWLGITQIEWGIIVIGAALGFIAFKLNQIHNELKSLLALKRGIDLRLED